MPFNGYNLKQARLMNDFTLEYVASLVDKTRQYISKLESGRARPSAELETELSRVLSVKPEFFNKPISFEVNEDIFHFRKKASTKVSVKKAFYAQSALLRNLIDLIEEYIELPECDFPDYGQDSLSLYDVELAAEKLRRDWGLGISPISNITKLVETKGAVITFFKNIDDSVDALSVSDRRPIVIRNTAKTSACRLRFDVAHELGHWVLHEGVVTGDRVTEKQANHFASAFLMPRSMFIKVFPISRRTGRISWSDLSALKYKIGVSKAAMLYRARSLDLLDDYKYKGAVIQMKNQGERQSEEEDAFIEPERPVVLERSLAMLMEHEGLAADDIADKLRIDTSLLTKILPFEIGTFKKLPKLRLV